VQGKGRGGEVIPRELAGDGKVQELALAVG
jgi:hypothetical protein